MITGREAIRVEGMINDALHAGGRVLVGGKRAGAIIHPTVLADVPEGSAMNCEEAYGPVMSVRPVASLDEAIERTNAVPFGLHAAVFTNNMRLAFDAVRRLQVGAVIINDSTDYRLDTMPFGGVKRSGVGREGVRFALEEMTETRVVCFNV